MRRNTPEYNSWGHMKARCYRKTHEFYHLYGGRGLVVCENWRNSFESFLTDMGLRPKGRYSIDRIDNNGNYSCGYCVECVSSNWPTNCRWADHSTQQLNRRPYKHRQRRVPDNIVQEIKKLLKDGLRGAKIAKMFSVSEMTVSYIKHSKYEIYK